MKDKKEGMIASIVIQSAGKTEKNLDGEQHNFTLNLREYSRNIHS